MIGTVQIEPVSVAGVLPGFDFGVSRTVGTGILDVRIVKISGKCAVRSGETVSPVEIVRSERYGTPLVDTHRNRSAMFRRRSFRSQNWNLVFALWPK